MVCLSSDVHCAACSRHGAPSIFCLALALALALALVPSPFYVRVSCARDVFLLLSMVSFRFGLVMSDFAFVLASFGLVLVDFGVWFEFCFRRYNASTPCDSLVFHTVPSVVPKDDVLCVLFARVGTSSSPSSSSSPTPSLTCTPASISNPTLRLDK